MSLFRSTNINSDRVKDGKNIAKDQGILKNIEAMPVSSSQRKRLYEIVCCAAEQGIAPVFIISLNINDITNILEISKEDSPYYTTCVLIALNKYCKIYQDENINVNQLSSLYKFFENMRTNNHSMTQDEINELVIDQMPFIKRIDDNSDKEFKELAETTRVKNTKLIIPFLSMQLSVNNLKQLINANLTELGLKELYNAISKKEIDESCLTIMLNPFDKDSEQYSYLKRSDENKDNFLLAMLEGAKEDFKNHDLKLMNAMLGCALNISYDKKQRVLTTMNHKDTYEGKAHFLNTFVNNMKFDSAYCEIPELAFFDISAHSIYEIGEHHYMYKEQWNQVFENGPFDYNRFSNDVLTELRKEDLDKDLILLYFYNPYLQKKNIDEIEKVMMALKITLKGGFPIKEALIKQPYKVQELLKCSFMQFSNDQEKQKAIDLILNPNAQKEHLEKERLQKEALEREQTKQLQKKEQMKVKSITTKEVL